VRFFQDCVEHRREVAGRTVDDPQHLGGRRFSGQRLVQLGRALLQFALEIGNDLLRISYRTIRLRAHLQASSDRLPSRIIPGPPRATTFRQQPGTQRGKAPIAGP
jgi:hypothetical protein